jgi:hypothetical protein
MVNVSGIDSAEGFSSNSGDATRGGHDVDMTKARVPGSRAGAMERNQRL